MGSPLLSLLLKSSKNNNIIVPIYYIPHMSFIQKSLQLFQAEIVKNERRQF